MLGDSFSYKTPYTKIIKTVKPNITLIPDFWGVNLSLTQFLCFALRASHRKTISINPKGLKKEVSFINDKCLKYN